MHQLVYEQSRQEFNNDVEKSIKSIEGCTGKKVDSLRASGFSINESNKWAFEELYNQGIKYDSTVFHVGRAHGGLPSSILAVSSSLEYNGLTLKEFPVNTIKFLGKPVIFSSGGYFRLFPYRFVKKWTEKFD